MGATGLYGGVRGGGLQAAEALGKGPQPFGWARILRCCTCAFEGRHGNLQRTSRGVSVFFFPCLRAALTEGPLETVAAVRSPDPRRAPQKPLWNSVPGIFTYPRHQAWLLPSPKLSLLSLRVISLLF